MAVIYISTAASSRKKNKKEALLGYDFTHGAINHASTLMKAVIVDKLGYPKPSIIQ